MKKIDLGQTINTLANIGVIAGIFFLAVEIRQNTRSAEVNAYQDLIGQISRLNELRIQNVRPFVLPNADRQLSLADLSPEEQEEVMSIALLVFRHGDMAFFQQEKGLISPERLDSVLGPLNASACNRMYQEVWSAVGDSFVQEYQDYVENRIASC